MRNSFHPDFYRTSNNDVIIKSIKKKKHNKKNNITEENITPINKRKTFFHKWNGDISVEMSSRDVEPMIKMDNSTMDNFSFSMIKS